MDKKIERKGEGDIKGFRRERRRKKDRFLKRARILESNTSEKNSDFSEKLKLSPEGLKMY